MFIKYNIGCLQPLNTFNTWIMLIQTGVCVSKSQNSVIFKNFSAINFSYGVGLRYILL